MQIPDVLPEFVVSAEGVAADPSKLETLRTWPVLSNRGQLRRFLGQGYYTRSMPKFERVYTDFSGTIATSWSTRRRYFVLRRSVSVRRPRGSLTQISQ